jgi:hypothetical protein
MDCSNLNILGVGIVCVSVGFLAIGLKGLVERKAFLLNAKWIWAIMFLCFGPQMLQSLCFLADQKHFDFIFIFSPIMLLFVLFTMWKQMSGYMAFGVTDESFRSALHTSLQKLLIPFEER